MLSGLAHLPCAARNCLVDFFFCFVYFLTLKRTCQAVISASQSLPGQHWTDANAANTIVLYFSVSFKLRRLFL